MTPLPLSGVRVVELCVVLAGPQAGLLLADLGAEVIRVESTQYFPPQTRGILAHPSAESVRNMIPVSGGYPNREPGERPWNRFPWFNTAARNKLGMTVTLTNADGRAVLERLVTVSDVLISNLAPGALDTLGLSYEHLRSVNPSLIYIAASSFGVSGPYRDYRALGLQMEAFAGHDTLRHYRDRDVSSNTWAVTSDAAGALGMALAAQMALYSRRRSGRGQFVDLSMIENFIGLIGPQILEYTLNRRVPDSIGNRDFSAVQGCYPCMDAPSDSVEAGSGALLTSHGGSPAVKASQGHNDRWLVLTLPDDEAWLGFCKASGQAQGTDDGRFTTVNGRLEHHDELDRVISCWTRSLPREEAVERLRDEGLMAGPVLDDADLMRDPHLAERGYFWTIPHTEAGTFRYPGPPYRFANASLSARYPPVRLGEHNERVYKDLLGVSAERYEQLTAEGHIGVDYAPNIR